MKHARTRIRLSCHKSYTAAFLLILPASMAISSSAASVHYRGIILNADGKAAAGATVSLYRVIIPHHLAIADRMTVGASGVFDFEAPSAPPNSFDVVRADGPTGIAVRRASRQPTTLILHPTVNAKIRLVDEAGAPVSGTVAHPKYLQEANAPGGPWDETIPSGWSAKTDANGIAVFTGLPTNYMMGLSIDNDRYVQPERTLLSLAPSMPLSTIRLARAGAVSGLVMYAQTHMPAAGIGVSVFAVGNGSGVESSITDSKGQYSISGLLPGRYETEIFSPLKQASEWTAPAQPINVAAATSTQAPALSLVHSAVLTGRITDVDSGRPLSNIIVYARDPSHPDDVSTLFATLTDQSGAYRLYVAPGTINVGLSGNHLSPDDLALKNTQIKEGETKAVDFHITALGPWPIQGSVVDSNGKALVGALILAKNQDTKGEIETVSDDQGQFRFQSPGLTPNYTITARAGALATPSPVRIVGPKALTLHTVPGLLCTSHGIITTKSGIPITGASVTLVRWMNGMDETLDTTHTDAKGTFSFKPNFSGGQYEIRVKAAGYANEYSDNKQADPGSHIQFVTHLVKADGFVNGMVVNRFGDPIAGADVQALDIDNSHVITNGKGQFHLNGVRDDGIVNIMVKAPQNRTAYYSLQSGINNARIYTLSEAEKVVRDQKADFIRANNTNMHGNGEDANILLSNAEKRASATGKRVFLMFEASWCGPCFFFSHFLENPEVKAIMDAHYVVLELDIFENDKKRWENPKGIDIYKHYGGDNTVPFWTILDPAGHAAGNSLADKKNTGIDGEHLLSQIRHTTPNISTSEIQSLRNHLKHIGDF